MNLTGVTEYDEDESEALYRQSDNRKNTGDAEGAERDDIGTGAGFPGIPLKIAFPHLKVVLLDSLNKRIKFLEAVIEELGLENISTIHGRAEDFAKKKEYREQFDLCVSRAVANLSTLSEYCLPFVAVNGSFVSYKSGDSEEEIHQAKHAISLLGGKVKNVDKFQLPGTDMDRALVK